MRVSFCVLVIVLFASLCGDSAAQEGNSMKALTMRIAETSSSGTITVQLGNSGKKPVRIWQDSNSWGAAHWRVLVIRKAQLETFFQNPDKDFTRNIPTFREIAGGAYIEQKLNLNGGDWRGPTGHRIQFAPDDLIVVIYDVPFTNEALKMRVWYGVVAALTTATR